MKSLYDNLSYKCSTKVTETYSTSFSLAVKMLSPSIRKAIYAIYGFVRIADEIVDSFHEYDKDALLTEFEDDLKKAINRRISTNPILNAFQHVVHDYQIDLALIDAFINSMRADLHLDKLEETHQYDSYIYGSADVVGLMCLRVFVDGDNERFNELTFPAEKLGSAFQKVNFLRDYTLDMSELDRSYFPIVNKHGFNNETLKLIIEEIESDFEKAYLGIKELPLNARFGVYTAYKYYRCLLSKIKRLNSQQIASERIRISNVKKIQLLATSFLSYKLNLL